MFASITRRSEASKLGKDSVIMEEENHLSCSTVVVYRIPSCDNFHEKYPKTIHITSLIEEASVGILRCYIPVPKTSFLINKRSKNVEIEKDMMAHIANRLISLVDYEQMHA
jgi:hypothetical protein